MSQYNYNNGGSRIGRVVDKIFNPNQNNYYPNQPVFNTGYIPLNNNPIPPYSNNYGTLPPGFQNNYSSDPQAYSNPLPPSFGTFAPASTIPPYAEAHNGAIPPYAATNNGTIPPYAVSQDGTIPPYAHHQDYHNGGWDQNSQNLQYQYQDQSQQNYHNGNQSNMNASSATNGTSIPIVDAGQQNGYATPSPSAPPIDSTPVNSSAAASAPIAQQPAPAPSVEKPQLTPATAAPATIKPADTPIAATSTTSTPTSTAAPAIAASTGASDSSSQSSIPPPIAQDATTNASRSLGDAPLPPPVDLSESPSKGRQGTLQSPRPEYLSQISNARNKLRPGASSIKKTQSRDKELMQTLSGALDARFGKIRAQEKSEEEEEDSNFSPSTGRSKITSV